MTLFTEQLPTLGALGAVDATSGGSATLTMVSALHSFHAALPPTPTFAYRAAGGSQTYLGPVIVARQNVPFNLEVRNDLGTHPLAFAIDPALVPAGSDDAAHPRTATHLHGGNTTVAFDGGPLETFTPGSSYVYEYGNTQEAAGLWYHDHALGITRLNVYAGLAGGYLLRDGYDTGDGTLLPAGTYEVPLVLQDRMFNPDGTLAYPANENPTTPRPWAPEFFGDVAVVNGKAWPNLDVDRGKYRFRVYNGSNARFYDLKFVAGDAALSFFQIGTDGGLLNAPVRLNSLLLGPGERADVVVDFAPLLPGTKVVITTKARVPFPDGPRAARRGGVPLTQIMQFTVGTSQGWTAPLPATLRSAPITSLTDLVPAQRRTMTLVEILDEADAPQMALLNNREFGSPDYALAPVASNTLEQWDLVNTTGDAHPIHLHFTQFQVLNRQRFDVDGYVKATYGDDDLTPGSGPYLPPGICPPVDGFLIGSPKEPPSNERGWKDTVRAMPGEVTRIRVPFGATVPGATGPLAIGASHTGEYAWHCHILEHEDNDMMQRYVIV
ncbi:multicopper oxidase [Cellulomonas sp. WB94]|uniref:multicopper oxidase family protein n=1 Tax=Cellulomonas sp. WB94 TaxID=2173174 RepID=UPI001F5BFC3E|nr:multicopper oxidase [Cellulomonas sp. WB94]